MTDPRRPKFIQKKFFLQDGDTNVELIGLMSAHGFTRIYSKDDTVAEIMAKIAGKPIDIRIDSFDLNSIIEKQFAEEGSFFEVRFINISPSVLEQLELKVEQEGSEPSWHRLHPRIAISTIATMSMNVPTMCVIKHGGQEHYLNVLNFTVGGLRLETMADILADIKVGHILPFDLVTTSGDSLFNIQGEVRNVGVHSLQDKKATEIRRSFGIKIGRMEPQNLSKYNEMIRRLCEALKRT